MKYLFVVIINVLCAMTASAQGEIKGKVVDGNRQAIEGASVVLFTVDSTYVETAVTDSCGLFSFGKAVLPYRLTITSMAHKTKTVAGTNTNAGDIVLEADSTMLSGVTVEGSRPMVRMENGRLVYDAALIREKKIVANAYDVAKEVPGIDSQGDKTLSIMGVPSSTVIVNGRRSNMDGSTLIEYLKSMPAERVKSVEVVYDATPEMRVTGPAINIVLTKPERDFSGLVGGQWINQHRNSGNLRGSAFLDTKHWSAYAMYMFADNNTRGGMDSHIRHLLDGQTYDIQMDTRTKQQTLMHYMYGNIGYKTDENRQIELTYIGMLIPKGDQTMKNTSNMFDNALSSYDGDRHWHDVQLAYNAQRLSANVEYMKYSTESTQDMTYMRTTGRTDAFSYFSRQDVDKLNGYVDMNNPLGKSVTMVYGASYNYVKSNNKQRNTDFENGGEGDYEKTSATEEHTAEAYAGLRLTLMNNRMVIYASLKDEWYKIKDYKHNTLMPNASLSYTINNKNYLQAYYTHQRNYPSYWSLQDYTTRSNEYEIYQGNPDLRSANRHQAGLVYVLNGKYVFNALFIQVNDFVITQNYQLPDRLLSLYKSFNIDYTSSWNFSVSAPVSIGKWFSTNLSASVFNERYKSDDWYGYAYDRNKWAMNVNANNTFTVSQKPKVSITLDAIYCTPTIQGVWNLTSRGYVNGGVAWQFANDRAVIQLQANDIFETMMPKMKNRFETQWSDVNYRHYLRSFTLSFTYKFKGYKDKSTKSADTSRMGM